MEEVILVATEAYPYAKSGGMGDVIGALFKYLPDYDFSVTLFLPAYRGVLDNYSFSLEREVDFYFGDAAVTAQFFKMEEGKQKIIAVQGKDLRTLASFTWGSSSNLFSISQGRRAKILLPKGILTTFNNSSSCSH